MKKKYIFRQESINLSWWVRWKQVNHLIGNQFALAETCLKNGNQLLAFIMQIKLSDKFW